MRKVLFTVTIWILSVLLIKNFQVTFSDLYLSFERSGDESSQFQEAIYLYVFVGLPLGTAILARNVKLVFDNFPTQPPVNMSLSGVWDDFLSATFYVGHDFLGFSTDYYSQTDINVTKTYAREAAQEFLRAFNFTSLVTISEREPSFNNQAKTVNFFWCFGPLSKTMENIEKFLKYRPNVGLGRLINRDFLNWYFPGNPSTALTRLNYVLEKNATSGSYSWKLTVEGSISELFSSGEKWIDLNTLLRNDKPITAASQGRSRVIVEISNQTTRSFFKTERYILTIQQISPAGHIATDDVENKVMYNWLLSPNSSLEDVTITLKTSKVVSSHLYFPTELLIPIISAVILSAIAVYAIYRCKLKVSNTPEKALG